MKLEKELRIAAPLARVAAALRTEAFHEASELARGAKSCTVRVTESGAGRLAFEVDTLEPLRGLTGTDHSKTERSLTRYSAEEGADRLCWTMQPHHFGGRIHLSGHHDLRADGDQTVVTVTMEARVNVPLVGRKIEKVITKEFEQTLPTFARVLGEHAQPV